MNLMKFSPPLKSAEKPSLLLKKIAVKNKEWIWVIDVLNDNEVAVYDENGKAM